MKTPSVSKWSRQLLISPVLALLVASAGATQFRLPVDSANSTVSVTLCADPGVGQDCDTDTANLTGFLVISLDDNNAPTQISLRDFDVQATRALNLNLSWVFGLARLDATATGVGLTNASPGPQNPFFGVAPGGGFTALNVPYQTRGLANYTASGLACTALQNNGQPCNGAFDLSTNGPGTIDSAPGTIQISGGIATVDLEITVTQYIDASNPSMGTLTLYANIRASAPVPAGLVPLGSNWRYLDNGSDQGTAWRASNFADSAWPLGMAQFGYGDGDEATTNQFGPDPNNKYITTYYRHAFNVANPASYTNLVLRLLRDDGAIVFLNGGEVFRSNMPDDPVGSTTLARAAVSGTEENLLFAKYLSPGLLQAGRNVLAVEVHQSTANSSDMSFDLELQGNFSFSNQLPVVTISNPTNGGVGLSSGFNLTAAASDPDGVVQLVEFFQNGVKIGQSTASPFTIGVTGLCAGTYSFMARAWDNSAQSADSPPASVNVIRPTQVLVAQGSEWKYLDNGTDQGTAWRGLAFNDGTWRSGRAELGYGDGFEVTTNSYGPDPNNRYITTYYRQKFIVTNASSLLGLQLRLVRDDGAVVYLNSNEVFRSNMPTGLVTYLTLATASIGGADETNFITGLIPTNYLVSGTNVIAVEIHQNATNSSDISFDLELRAGSGNLAPWVVMTNPVDRAEFPAGASVVLQAIAADADGGIGRVEFYEGTNQLGQIQAPPFQLLPLALPSGSYTLTARAYDDCGAGSTSAPVRITVGAFSMVHTSAVWKYLDTGVYPGVAWTSLGFNDSAWLSGPAQLGYGDNDEATVVSYGPNINNKYITTWFRRAWVVTDKSLVTGLSLRLLRDDGAVVYLNGTEVFRSNLPQGPITATTLATNAVSGGEENAWFTQAVSPALLVNGTNILAVEVHQNATNSSDLSFSLEIAATVSPAQSYVRIIPGTGVSTLRWPSWAIGYRLYEANTLHPPVQWRPLPAAMQDDGTWRSVTLPVSSTNTYYRIGW